jgi:hypothetical protein
MTAQIAEQLRNIVRTAEPALRALTEAQVSSRPASDRWTIKEVLGHLIDSAANNHQRFVRAQFTDSFVFPKYAQNEWVGAQHYNDSAWGELLDLWSAYNRHLAHVMKHVAPQAFDVPCTIGDYVPVTLQFLMEDYLVHLRHHLTKIAVRLNMLPEKVAG